MQYSSRTYAKNRIYTITITIREYILTNKTTRHSILLNRLARGGRGNKKLTKKKQNRTKKQGRSINITNTKKIYSNNRKYSINNNNKNK